MCPRTTAGPPYPRVSRRTAFRKLKDLDARTSYSHRGGYYTLDELADFDEHGLWAFAGVRFSRAGTPVATAEAFVNHAQAGHFVDELDNRLGVGTQDALRKLVGDGRLTRHKLAGQFLYCATDHAQETHQLRARRLLMATPGLGRPLPDPDLMLEEMRLAARRQPGHASADAIARWLVGREIERPPPRPGPGRRRPDGGGGAPSHGKAAAREAPRRNRPAPRGPHRLGTPRAARGRHAERRRSADDPRRPAGSRAADAVLGECGAVQTLAQESAGDLARIDGVTPRTTAVFTATVCTGTPGTTPLSRPS